MTWFGWVYTTLTVIGITKTVYQIGQPKGPTNLEAIGLIISSTLVYWGLFAVGLKH